MPHGRPLHPSMPTQTEWVRMSRVSHNGSGPVSSVRLCTHAPRGVLPICPSTPCPPPALPFRVSTTMPSVVALPTLTRSTRQPASQTEGLRDSVAAASDCAREGTAGRGKSPGAAGRTRSRPSGLPRQPEVCRPWSMQEISREAYPYPCMHGRPLLPSVPTQGHWVRTPLVAHQPRSDHASHPGAYAR